MNELCDNCEYSIAPCEHPDYNEYADEGIEEALEMCYEMGELYEDVDEIGLWDVPKPIVSREELISRAVSLMCCAECPCRDEFDKCHNSNANACENFQPIVE